MVGQSAAELISCNICKSIPSQWYHSYAIPFHASIAMLERKHKAGHYLLISINILMNSA